MKHRFSIATAAALVAGVAAWHPSQTTVRAKDVTFTEDVAPIVFSKCATCHRPGEAAPFSLLTYDDVKRRGKIVAAAVSSRAMPPWKGHSDYAYLGDRRLTDAQIATITSWVDAGMPEGDTARLPPTPKFTPGWQLGEPDLVVSMKTPFDVPAEGPDVYRNFVIPTNLTEDKWVRVVDFRPSARAVVHHSLFFFDGTGTARGMDGRDGKPGFPGEMGGLAGARGNVGKLLSGAVLGGRVSPSAEMADEARIAGVVGGWVLGAQPRPLPEGLAIFVPKGADLIVSTHFHPSGKVEHEQSTLGLYFASEPPTRAFAGIQLPPLFGITSNIDIPPGEPAFTIKDSWTLPVDVNAFNVGGHAHYLAKTMTLTATFPDGATKTLLQIDDWDFAWQDQFPYASSVALPKGTRLDATITYDNSSNNPRNPSKPPVRVTWGEQSTDEMGSIGLLVVAANDAELPELQRSYAQHLQQTAMRSPQFMRTVQRLLRQQMPQPSSPR